MNKKRLKNVLSKFRKIFFLFKITAFIFIISFEFIALLFAILIFALFQVFKDFDYKNGEINFSILGNDRVYLKCDLTTFYCDYIKYQLDDRNYKLSLNINNFSGILEKFGLDRPKILISANSVNFTFTQKIKEENNEKFQYPYFLKLIPKIVKYLDLDIKKIDISIRNIPDNYKLKLTLGNLKLKNKSISFYSKFGYNSEIYLKNKSIVGNFKKNRLILKPTNFYINGQISKFNIPNLVFKTENSYFDFSNFSFKLPVNLYLNSKNLRLDNSNIQINNLKLKIVALGNEENIFIKSSLNTDNLKLLQDNKGIVFISNIKQKINILYDFSNLFIKDNGLNIQKITVLPANLYLKNIQISLMEGVFHKIFENINTKVEKLTLNSIPIKFEDIESDKIQISNIKAKSSFDLENEVLSGNLLIDDKRVNYLLNFKEEYLNINFPKFYLTDLTKHFVHLSKKYKNLKKYIYLALSGSVKIDLKENNINSKLKLSNINFYGLKYQSGDIGFKLSFKDNIALDKLKLNLYNIKDKSFISLNGSFKEKSIDFNFTWKNLDISSLEPLKEKNLNFLADLNGNIKGKINNLNGNVFINIKNLGYKNINIPPTKLDINFEINNNLITVKTSQKGLNLISKFDIKREIINFNLNFKEFNLQDYIKFYKDKIPEAIYKDLRIAKINGNIEGDIDVKRNSFNGNINIGEININIPRFEENFILSINGNVKDSIPNIEFSLRKSSSKSSKILKNVSLEGKLLDKKFSANYSLVGAENLKNISLKGGINIDFDKNLIYYSMETNIKKQEILANFRIVGDGTFEKTKGKIFSNLTVGNSTSSNKIDYLVERKKEGILTELSFDKLSFKYDDYSAILNRFIGRFFIKNNDFKNISGVILSDGGSVKKLNRALLGIEPFELTFIDGKVVAYKPIKITNLIDGKISKLEYDLKSNTLKLKSFGKLNKIIVSELITLGGLDGELRISLGFNGNINDYKNNLTLSIFSNNLQLKSSFTRRPLKFEDLKIDYLKNSLRINIKAKVISHLYGQGYLSIGGVVDLDKEKHTIRVRLYKLPIRYRSIFVGDVSTKNFNIYIVKDNSKENKIGYNLYLKGNIYYSGRLRINKEFQKLFLTEKAKEYSGLSKKLDELKKHIFLDLNISTDNPLTIKGIFGRAMAISSIKVSNTLYNPMLDGYFKVLGGKINFMKIKYTINKLEINIVKNKMYINGQLSTFLYDTRIFINIFGNLKNPNITFISQPPKTRQEIMSMLFLKDLPSALSGLTTDFLPLIRDLGALFTKLIPTEEEDEGEGLFNTGIEVSIKPEYSPTEGLVPFIYAKRSISTRIYIAISRALVNNEAFKNSGWYEVGIRLGGDFIFRYRFFENNQEEYSLTLSTQFDF